MIKEQNAITAKIRPHLKSLVKKPQLILLICKTSNHMYIHVFGQSPVPVIVTL